MTASTPNNGPGLQWEQILEERFKAAGLNPQRHYELASGKNADFYFPELNVLVEAKASDWYAEDTTPQLVKCILDNLRKDFEGVQGSVGVLFYRLGSDNLSRNGRRSMRDQIRKHVLPQIERFAAEGGEGLLPERHSYPHQVLLPEADTQKGWEIEVHPVSTSNEAGFVSLQTQGAGLRGRGLIPPEGEKYIQWLTKKVYHKKFGGDIPVVLAVFEDRSHILPPGEWHDILLIGLFDAYQGRTVQIAGVAVHDVLSEHRKEPIKFYQNPFYQGDANLEALPVVRWEPVDSLNHPQIDAHNVALSVLTPTLGVVQLFDRPGYPRSVGLVSGPDSRGFYQGVVNQFRTSPLLFSSRAALCWVLECLDQNPRAALVVP